jgi:hypothetical protein
MNEVIEVLHAEPYDDTLGYSNNTTPLSVTASKSVTETWKALLFSEKCSDIKFQCQDGTVFHAHKNILAAASPYFSTAFEGPWGGAHGRTLGDVQSSWHYGSHRTLYLCGRSQARPKESNGRLVAGYVGCGVGARG